VIVLKGVLQNSQSLCNRPSRKKQCTC